MKTVARGFGLIALLIAVAIVALLGGGKIYLDSVENRKSSIEIGKEAEKKAQEAVDLINSRNQETKSAENKKDSAQTKSISDVNNIPTPSVGTIDISTWKTYRNAKYGFEVKYPQDWGHDGKNDSVIINFGSQGVDLSREGSVRFLEIDSGCIFATGFEGFEVTEILNQVKYGDNLFEEKVVYPVKSSKDEFLLRNFNIQIPSEKINKMFNHCPVLSFVLHIRSIEEEKLIKILSTFRFLE